MLRSCHPKFRSCHFLILCVISVISLICLNVNFSAMFRHISSNRYLMYAFNKDSLFSSYTMNGTTPSRCDMPLFVVVYVHTSPSHFVQRKVIRYTWGHPRVAELLNFTVVFMIGNTSDSSVQKGIESEMETYNDIIQFSFLDSYKNLSYKAMESIDWVWESCRNAEFVVKSDDDMLINMFGLVKMLHSFTGDKHPGNKFICCRWIGMPILRNNNSKWYVSESDMQGKVYPHYCSGSVYIFPMQLTGRLHDAIAVTRFFWVDDVYATGLLANTTGAGFLPINSRYKFDADVKHTKEIVDEKILFAHVYGDQGIGKRMIIWESVLMANIGSHR